MWAPQLTKQKPYIFSNFVDFDVYIIWPTNYFFTTSMKKRWIQRSLRHRVHESSSGTSFAAVFGPLTTRSFSWGPPATSHADGIDGSPPKFRNTLRETNASDRDRSIAPKDLDLYIRTIWPWKGISSFRKTQEAADNEAEQSLCAWSMST